MSIKVFAGHKCADWLRVSYQPQFTITPALLARMEQIWQPTFRDKATSKFANQ
jgi:hypothetical protein